MHPQPISVPLPLMTPVSISAPAFFRRSPVTHPRHKLQPQFRQKHHALIVPKIVVKASSDSAFSSSPQSHIPTSSQVTVLSAAHIQRSAAASVNQVLRGGSGVQLHDSGDGRHVAISLRGFGANAAQNSLVLVNGVPLDNPSITTPDLNQLPLANIARIDIIPGSEGVLFGDQAVGGVVNIVSKRPKKLHDHASISAGSYGTQVYRATVAKAFNNGLGVSLSAKKYNSHHYRANNKEQFSTLAGQLDYKYVSGFWHIYYRYHHDRNQFPGALTASQLHASRRQAAPGSAGNFASSDGQLFHVQQQQHLSTNWKIMTDMVRRQQHGHGFLFSPFAQREVTSLLQSRLVGLIHGALLTTGVVLAKAHYQLTGTTSAARDRQQRVAAFTQVNIPLSQHVTMIAGMRGARLFNRLRTGMSVEKPNQLRTTNSALVSTIGFSWKPQSWLRFYLRRAGSFRFPKADEESFTPASVRGLKTQTGVSYETGLVAHRRRWQAAVLIYQLDLTHEIAFNPLQTPERPFGSNRNLAPTQRIGAIVSLRYAVNSRVLVGGQYTRTDARFCRGHFSGNAIPMVADAGGNVYAVFSVTPHVDAYGQLTYTGSRFPDEDDANEGSKLSGYVLLNVSVRLHRRHYFATVRINNVFNRHYNAYTLFSPLTTSSAVSRFFYPAPGRNVMVTIGVTLR